MNEAIKVTEKDELIMRLVHYFVTKENYAPIMVNGVKNEIWLENLEANYKIVRINSNYIHNNEQMEYDVYKILNVNKQIKKRTLSRKLKTLNILTDTGSNVTKFPETNMVDNIVVKSNEDLSNKDGILSLFPLINEEDIKDIHGLDFLLNVSNDINKKTEKENEFYESVFKEKKIVVTKILILINIIMFLFSLLCEVSGKYDVLSNLALNKFYVKNGEIYRLITSGFLHGNIMHLICNMYSLNIIGSQIESFLGKKKFIIIYLISLITGNLLSCVINSGFSLGASGAIFGLLGSLIFFGYHYRIYFGSVLKTQIIPLLVLNLMIGFIIPNIDMSAHIGGLAGGILATMSVGISNKTTKSEKINGIVCLIILTIFLSYLIVK